MLHDGIMITVVSVFGNLQVHRRTIEGYLLAARINEMGHGGEGTHVVIHHHSGAVHPRTDSIDKDERHAIVHQLLEMVILLGILRLRNDDATHLILIEVFTDSHFSVVSLLALRHHHTIALGSRLLLNSREDRHKIIMNHLGDDNSDYLHRLHPAVAKSLADDVRIEVMFTRVCLNTLLLGSTDSRTVLQRSAHRGNAYPQVASNILHCYIVILVHVVSKSCCKIRQISVILYLFS